MTELWRELTELPHFVWAILLVVVVLVAAVAANRIINGLLRRSYLARMDRIAAASGVAELARVKRQRTLVTLLESLVRYGVYGAALVIIINIVRPGASSALFSVTLLGVLLGFGLQRLLADVVAGALLIFEGHFAVGDVISVHQYKVTGTVERVSLRTTTLRTTGDDRIVILNGGLISMTRWSYGQRAFRIELLVAGAAGEAAARAIVKREATAADALWVRPPHVVSVDEAPDTDTLRIRINVSASPEHDAVVERLGRQLEHELAAAQLLRDVDVLVLPLHDAAFEAWRSGVLVRD